MKEAYDFYYNDVQQEDIDKGLIKTLISLLQKEDLEFISYDYDEQNEILKITVTDNLNRTPNELFNIKRDIKAEAKRKAIQEKLEAARKEYKVKRIQEKLEAARNDSNERKTIREKLERARKKQQIQEKLERARSNQNKKSVTDDKNDQLKKQIIEKLEVSRRKKMIQERIMKAKETK